jgi:tRNA threonylcarbamoyladenosine biosynthesis protein TsaE
MQRIAGRRWLTHSAEDTQTLGACLGRQAREGDFVACCGTLGAGKTTFIQGFAQGLDVGADAYVRSPTFTLLHIYYGRFPLYHFDFYRLPHYTEVQDIGFEDYCEANGVVIVEWADKFPELLPLRRLDIHIQIVSSENRLIQGTTYDRSYARYLHLPPTSEAEIQ